MSFLNAITPLKNSIKPRTEYLIPDRVLILSQLQRNNELPLLQAAKHLLGGRDRHLLREREGWDGCAGGGPRPLRGTRVAHPAEGLQGSLVSGVTVCLRGLLNSSFDFSVLPFGSAKCRCWESRGRGLASGETRLGLEEAAHAPMAYAELASAKVEQGMWLCPSCRVTTDSPTQWPSGISFMKLEPHLPRKE